jgi:hypothetical protein
MAFNQDHVSPADFFVDFQMSEGRAIGRRCLWMDTKGSFAGTGGGSVAETFTQTIPLTPDMNGKTIVPISWQKSHHTGTKDYDKWGYFTGSDFTLTVIVNPANSITANNSGTTTAYNDTPVVVSATVTPPDYANYTYGMRVSKWVGQQNEAPGSGGSPWVEVYSGSMLSGQQPWSGTIQPGLAEVPGQIVYRLLSWQTGAAENANPVDCAIIVPNRAPSGAAVTLTHPETGQNATAIEYGQSVGVSGNLLDADGDLRGHSLWVIAPADDGSKDPEWYCISRPLDPDWWGGPTSNNGWNGPWGNGHPSNGTNSTVTGVFTPWRCGIWQLHTNGCDTAGAWGPGDTKDLVVAKATPNGTYLPAVLLQYAGLTAAHLNASFVNPHNGASVAGTVSYNLVESGTLGQALAPGMMLAPGAYTVRASLSASDNYNATHVDATLVVDGNPDGDNNGNAIPNWIENELGLNPNAPNNANSDLEINIHTPVN